MKKLKYIIPNGITILNLLAGSLACVYAFEDSTGKIAIYLIVAAAIFDLLDGLVAKLLNATSEFGKQLDSLADVISFGLAPSFLLYRILQMGFVKMGEGSFILESPSFGQRLILFSAFAVAAFAALRLARFNISTSKSVDFQGLPVPANALFVLSLWIVLHYTENDMVQSIVLNIYIILAVIVLLSFLMVSNIPMISFKFKNFSLAENYWRYLLIIGSIIMFMLFGISSLFFIMTFYIVLSLIKSLISEKNQE